MRKIYYLHTCSTCQRILKDWNVDESFTLQDIKAEKMIAAQVDQLIEMAGSADALFSRRAIKYKSLGLKDQKLTEAKIRSLIIEEYTFLKRPVLLLDTQIFIGNSPAVVSSAKAAIDQS